MKLFPRRWKIPGMDSAIARTRSAVRRESFARANSRRTRPPAVRFDHALRSVAPDAASPRRATGRSFLIRRDKVATLDPSSRGTRVIWRKSKVEMVATTCRPSDWHRTVQLEESLPRERLEPRDTPTNMSRTREMEFAVHARCAASHVYGES